MPKYTYEIQKASDNIATGVIDAESLMEASDWARQQGGYLLNIELAPGAGDFIAKLRSFRLEFPPGLKDVLYFTKQLSVMVRAGISIRDAVEGISDHVENQKFKKILKQAQADVEAGMPFSAALARNPRVFGSLYVNMVRASEMSGTFAHMLDRVGMYLEQQADTRSMIKGAMIYPAILLTMSISAVVFLLTWVLPRFMKVFEGKEHLLPKPTKMLMAISYFLQHQWYILIAIIVTLVVGFILTLRTDTGKLYFDKFKLRAPVFRKMFRAVYIARGLQTMGELINAGVPMLETLEITADISGNIVYRDLWLSVRDSVKEGNKIVTPLRKGNLFPKSVVQMVSAGEESGRLGEVLQDVSEFYAKELKETIKATTSLIEPVMIVFMGVVVGFIAMSIILPVFKMSAVASGAKK